MTSTFWPDVRHAVRWFAKSPGFVAVAVLTLALGVGANTAIFSVLHAVVLRDLPYRDADRVAVMWTWNLQQNLPDGSSYLNFRDWKAQSREFEQMAAYIRPEFTRGTLSGDGPAVRVNVGMVGPGFFELLGTAPVAGRAFVTGDYVEGASAVVISHGLWQQRFGRDPRIVGRTIQVDGAGAEVVGVMPPEFALPTADVQLWRPIWFGPAWQDERSRAADSLIVLGRLRSGATLDSARAEMDAIAARLRTQYARTNASFGVTTDALVDRVVGPTTQRSLWLLFGSVGFVLLIACANVANLMLVRVSGRSAEFSVRTALGATRARLIAHALAENLVLSLLGAVVGALIGWLGVLGLRAWAAGVLPRAETIQLNGGVLLFALTAALGCGLLAGLLPALQLSSDGTASALRSAGTRLLGGPGGRRLHHGLVVVEIALAVVLLSGAGLLIRSFVRVQTTARGFDSSNVLLLQVDLPARYDNRQKVAAFYDEALRRIRALPGVITAGAVSDFFIHRQPDFRIALEGRPARRPSDAAPPLTGDNVVPGYFEAMRIPLLRGRSIDDRDLVANAPPVVMINEEMARRFWPGEDPVGKRFKYGLDPSADMPWTAVVGVVADMRRQQLDEPPIPYMFRPGPISQMDVAVRTSGHPDALRNAIRAQIEALDPAAPPYGIITVEERLSQSVALRRFQTLLLATLAVVALLLALVGAYGIIHRSVASRTQEIGIRSALGASARTIATMVLASGLSLGVAGLVIGLLGSVALSRVVASFLYETSPFDPLTYLAVAALLFIVTTAATLTPARRAARIDPIAALRDR